MKSAFKSALQTLATGAVVAEPVPDHFRTLDRDAFDVIVIGAGTGGLTAADLLAQRGPSVLVLDRRS